MSQCTQASRTGLALLLPQSLCRAKNTAWRGVLRENGVRASNSTEILLHSHLLIHTRYLLALGSFFEMFKSVYQGSFVVSTWESGLISCGDMQVHSLLELEKQGQASCRVDIGIGGFLSRCHRAVTPAIVF